MTATSETEVYYDPYDFEIDIDPYPTWKRMREEMPLYHNEKYDFFAVSRFDDVEPALVDWASSSRSTPTSAEPSRPIGRWCRRRSRRSSDTRRRRPCRLATSHA